VNQGIFIFCPARAKSRRALIAYREISPKNRKPASTYRRISSLPSLPSVPTSRSFAHRPRLIALNRGCSRLFAPTTRIRVNFFWGASSRFFQSGVAIHPSIYRGFPPNRFPQTNFKLDQTCSKFFRVKKIHPPSGDVPSVVENGGSPNHF